jgi:hypothetical protein
MSDLKDFRGPLPLTDADFTRIRASVIAKTRGRTTTFVWRWSFAALAATFAALIAWNALRVPQLELAPPARTHGPIAAAPVPPPLPAQLVQQQPVPAAPVRVAHRQSTRPAVATAATTPSRIEIHTSDPDIRIIWLPNTASSKRPEEKS